MEIVLSSVKSKALFYDRICKFLEVVQNIYRIEVSAHIPDQTSYTKKSSNRTSNIAIRILHCHWKSQKTADNSTIMIKPSDEGSNIVIMNNEYYAMPWHLDAPQATDTGSRHRDVTSSPLFIGWMTSWCRFCVVHGCWTPLPSGCPCGGGCACRGPGGTPSLLWPLLMPHSDHINLITVALMLSILYGLSSYCKTQCPSLLQIHTYAVAMFLFLCIRLTAWFGGSFRTSHITGYDSSVFLFLLMQIHLVKGQHSG